MTRDTTRPERPQGGYLLRSDADQDINLRHLVGVLRQRAWVIVVLVVVAVLAAYLLAHRSPNLYEATSEVRITNPNANNVFQTGAAVAVDPTRLVDTETGVIQSWTLSDAVNQKLGASSDLIEKTNGLDKVTITNPPSTDLLQISVTSQSPQVAMDAANVFAGVYVASRTAQAVSVLDQRSTELRSKAVDLGKQIEALDTQIATAAPSAVPGLQAQRSALVTQQADFSNRASQFEVESSLRGGDVQVVDQASLPTAPISPKPVRDAALAGVLALLIGVALVFVLDRLDDRITDPDELESLTDGVPLFGSVPIYAPDKKHGANRLPHGPRTLVPLHSIDAEVYRTLRTNLRFSSLGKTKSVIMVTSPTTARGQVERHGQPGGLTRRERPACRRHLGRPAPARAGQHLRHRRDGQGLTSMLLGDAVVTDCLVPYELDSGHRIYVLPAGRCLRTRLSCSALG